MSLSLIKTYLGEKTPKFHKPFVAKSKFIDLESKKDSYYVDFRVDYLPLTAHRVNYQSLLRAWYLLLLMRTAGTLFVSNKTAVFSHRNTKLFMNYQDTYEVSINKNFYSTLVKHRNLFYQLTVSTPAIDRLYLILSLYTFKVNAFSAKTVIKKSLKGSSSHKNLINFLLTFKWRFKIIEFSS